MNFAALFGFALIRRFGVDANSTDFWLPFDVLRFDFADAAIFELWNASFQDTCEYEFVAE